MLSTIKLINRLEKVYDVKVIISSAWKLNKTFNDFISRLKKKKELINRVSIKILAEKLINKFKDKTSDWLHCEDSYYNQKELEIMEYLESHNIKNDKILILDDERVNIKYDNQVYWKLDENFGMNDFDLELLLMELL